LIALVGGRVPVKVNFPRAFLNLSVPPVYRPCPARCKVPLLSSVAIPVIDAVISP
jgi:hypothetical protein